MEHSNDISLHFLHCPECDTQWRSHHLQTCEHCSTMGLTLVLDDAQVEALLKAVRTQCYGVNDETDLLFVLSEMRDWSDVPTALLAQACWMYLRTKARTKKIMIAMEYFEDRFQESLIEENDMEYMERFDPLVEENDMEYMERFDPLVEA